MYMTQYTMYVFVYKCNASVLNKLQLYILLYVLVVKRRQRHIRRCRTEMKTMSDRMSERASKQANTYTREKQAGHAHFIYCHLLHLHIIFNGFINISSSRWLILLFYLFICSSFFCFWHFINSSSLLRFKIDEKKIFHIVLLITAVSQFSQFL